MPRSLLARSAYCGSALLLTLGLGCAAPPSDPDSRLILTGSSTVAPLITEIARRYEKTYPPVRVDVQRGGSSRGVADARQGSADLGMMSRSLADDESDLQTFTVARDGVGLIVHAQNSVPTLSHEQVIGIFKGSITRWSEVGGADAEITVVNKAEGRATLEVFRKHFGLESTEIQADVVIGHNEQGIKTIAGNPHAIGYVSIGVASSDIQHGIPIRLRPVDGIDATLDALAEGRFPISRPLNLVSHGAPSPAAQRFIDYCLSEEVHDLIEAQRFVPSRR